MRWTERLFVFLIRLLAVVMFVAGAITILFGTALVAGAGDPNSAMDSEFRFFGVWYSLAGLALFQASRSSPVQRTPVRMVGAAFFVAGCARLLSWITVGKPHWTQVVLMITELVLPFVIIPWQAAIERRRG